MRTTGFGAFPVGEVWASDGVCSRTQIGHSALLLLPLLVIVAIAPTASAQDPVGVEQDERPFRVGFLGDSYIAGNGAVNADPGDCYRSTNSWASMWIGRIVPEGQVYNLACSGYEIAQIQETVGGIEPHTDLIVLSAGGNDLGFGLIVLNCLVLADPLGCRDVVALHRNALEKTEDDLVTLFNSIHARSPTSKVILVGYPHLIDDHEPPVVLDDELSRYGLQTHLRDFAIRGEEAQIRAVRRANAASDQSYASFVSVKPLFDGHAPGPLKKEPIGEPWIYDVEVGVTDPKVWYHYNPTGHIELANHMARCLTGEGISENGKPDGSPQLRTTLFGSASGASSEDDCPSAGLRDTVDTHLRDRCVGYVDRAFAEASKVAASQDDVSVSDIVRFESQFVDTIDDPPRKLHLCDVLPIYYPGVDLGAAGDMRQQALDHYPIWAVQARTERKNANSQWYNSRTWGPGADRQLYPSDPDWINTYKHGCTVRPNPDPGDSQCDEFPNATMVYGGNNNSNKNVNEAESGTIWGEREQPAVARVYRTDNQADKKTWEAFLRICKIKQYGETAKVYQIPPEDFFLVVPVFASGLETTHDCGTGSIDCDSSDTGSVVALSVGECGSGSTIAEPSLFPSGCYDVTPTGSFIAVREGPNSRAVLSLFERLPGGQFEKIYEVRTEVRRLYDTHDVAFYPGCPKFDEKDRLYYSYRTAFPSVEYDCGFNTRISPNRPRCGLAVTDLYRYSPRTQATVNLTNLIHPSNVYARPNPVDGHEWACKPVVENYDVIGGRVYVETRDAVCNSGGRASLSRPSNPLFAYTSTLSFGTGNSASPKLLLQDDERLIDASDDGSVVLFRVATGGQRPKPLVVDVNGARTELGAPVRAPSGVVGGDGLTLVFWPLDDQPSHLLGRSAGSDDSFEPVLLEESPVVPELSGDGRTVFWLGQVDAGFPWPLPEIRMMDITDRNVIALPPFNPQGLVHASASGRYLLFRQGSGSLDLLDTTTDAVVTLVDRGDNSFGGPNRPWTLADNGSAVVAPVRVDGARHIAYLPTGVLDGDGDGYASTEAGGIDCDDTDRAVGACLPEHPCPLPGDLAYRQLPDVFRFAKVAPGGAQVLDQTCTVVQTLPEGTSVIVGELIDREGNIAFNSQDAEGFINIRQLVFDQDDTEPLVALAWGVCGNGSAAYVLGLGASSCIYFHVNGTAAFVTTAQITLGDVGLSGGLTASVTNAGTLQDLAGPGWCVQGTLATGIGAMVGYCRGGILAEGPTTAFAGVAAGARAGIAAGFGLTTVEPIADSDEAREAFCEDWSVVDASSIPVCDDL